jgi:uncharacterized membrane protein (DUF2068 family)
MHSHDRMLRLIAIFKFFKAATFLAVGVGAFRLVHQDIPAVAEHWIKVFGLDPGTHVLNAALAKVADLSPAQIKKLGLGSFIYAGLFLTEGIGLWMLKRWAEWFTVIITASLVPIEIYEIYRHASVAKFAVLAINLAVMVYLVYHIREKR